LTRLRERRNQLQQEQAQIVAKLAEVDLLEKLLSEKPKAKVRGARLVIDTTPLPSA
jgi:hypothetical protein